MNKIILAFGLLIIISFGYIYNLKLKNEAYAQCKNDNSFSAGTTAGNRQELYKNNTQQSTMEKLDKTNQHGRKANGVQFGSLQTASHIGDSGRQPTAMQNKGQNPTKGEDCGYGDKGNFKVPGGPQEKPDWADRECGGRPKEENRFDKWIQDTIFQDDTPLKEYEPEGVISGSYYSEVLQSWSQIADNKNNEKFRSTYNNNEAQIMQADFNEENRLEEEYYESIRTEAIGHCLERQEYQKMANKPIQA